MDLEVTGGPNATKGFGQFKDVFCILQNGGRALGKPFW